MYETPECLLGVYNLDMVIGGVVSLQIYQNIRNQLFLSPTSHNV